MNTIAPPPAMELIRFAQAVIAEDLGRGDITTAATVNPRDRGMGTVVFRTAAVVCGIPVAKAIFRELDPDVRFDDLATEGAKLSSGGAALRIECGAGALLTGERTALNAIARLAATATLTRRFVDAIAGTGAQILDTRKTTPGMRMLEKYAVRVGGGRNHRTGLDDGILIKDNHLRLAGGVTEAVRRAKGAAHPGIRVEVEVETLDELREALAAGADMILLDNMSPALLREAVAITAKRVTLEASGGVSLDTVRTIAETGVDFISVGALTHSAGSVDVSLEV